MEYLGFWVTPEGIRLLNKKIESITNMAPQTSYKELRALIVLENYYQDMWEKNPHTFKPLTRLVSK